MGLTFAKSPAATPFSLVALLSFVGLVVWNTKVRRILKRREIYRGILACERATKQRHWPALAELPNSADEAKLPRYFSDLDLIGEYSLLRLINTTLSNTGFQKLKELFESNEADNETILQRQAIVKELQGKRAFRRKILLLGKLESDAVFDLLSLDSFLAHPFHSGQGKRLVTAMLVLYAAAVVLAAGYISKHIGPFFLIPWFGAFAVFSWASSHFYNPFLRAVALESSLSRFSHIARLLESYKAKEGTALANLLKPFQSAHRPSAAFRKLAFLVSLLSTRANPLLYILVHIVFPLDYLVTLALERFRLRLRQDVAQWTDSFSQLESFLSLAGLADIFKETANYPILVPNRSRTPLLIGENVRHPLLSDDRSVGNSVKIDASHWCYLITGSNMSGKSTFLRTLGSNLLLAKAGAPVFAASFNFSNSRLYSMLRVADSLEDQVSSFYAEVKALKVILDAAGESEATPVFYLIDEIFRGTNNRERLVGSRAYIETMAKLRAGGLIATHDLELAELADKIPGISNYHFKEIIEDNKMSFTYHIQAGPCPTTNALRIMELAGLPVPKS